jgi:hypothetical protein
VGTAGGGEHHDHRGIFGAGDALAELVAVYARQVAVEEDCVVGIDVDLAIASWPS